MSKWLLFSMKQNEKPHTYTIQITLPFSSKCFHATLDQPRAKSNEIRNNCVKTPTAGKTEAETCKRKEDEQTHKKNETKTKVCWMSKRFQLYSININWQLSFDGISFCLVQYVRPYRIKVNCICNAIRLIIPPYRNGIFWLMNTGMIWWMGEDISKCI